MQLPPARNVEILSDQFLLTPGNGRGDGSDSISYSNQTCSHSFWSIEHIEHEQVQDFQKEVFLLTSMKGQHITFI